MKKKTIRKIIYIFAILVVISIVVLVVYKYIFFPKRYSDIVEKACKLYNVDPNLVYSVIKQESKFNKLAISNSKAKGLMQIMDDTAKDMAANISSIDEDNIDLFDPYTNIFIGTKYLSYLIGHFDGNYYLAIAAYNAGLGKVDKWVNKDYIAYTDLTEFINIIKYNETKLYVINVFNNYKYYTLLYNK